jgi:hypothetical protein
MENHEMSEEKRAKIYENLQHYIDNENLTNKLKLEKELKERHYKEKMKMVVKNIFDLQEKYSDHLIEIDSYRKIVTLKNPIEVKYFRMFSYECSKLGFKCEIKSNMIDYYHHSYI